MTRDDADRRAREQKIQQRLDERVARKNRSPHLWTWIQPMDGDELLTRLLDARDLNMPARERENLCGCAYTEIRQLQRELAAERQARAALEQVIDTFLSAIIEDHGASSHVWLMARASRLRALLPGAGEVT